jgi:hypothetical protein
MPVLNFVADAGADAATWKAQLARLGLHVVAEFDTVVYLREAEHTLFDKLGTLLEAKREALDGLMALRDEQHGHRLEAACRAIGELLCNAAGARVRGEPDDDPLRLAELLHARIRREERRSVDALLELFRFDLGTFEPPALPLENGEWQLDLFDPETLKGLGIRLTTGAATGAALGLVVDAMSAGISLGAATAIGGAIGAGISTAVKEGREFLDRRRGYREIALMPEALAALAARETTLLAALLRRGHASLAPVVASSAGGWPSSEIRHATLRCRSHPDWSALNEKGQAAAEQGCLPIASAVRSLFDAP